MAKAPQKDDLDGMIEDLSKKDPKLAEVVDALTAARQLMRRLIEVRVQKGLSQKQVADKLETTQSAIARLEAGDTDPRLSTAMRYAQAVGKKLQVK